MAALGLSGAPQTAIQNLLTADSQASGYGSPNPTDAAWITREVELTAGVTYTMSWNYLGTDYVPFNDGSLTSLVPVTVESEPTITVNNYVEKYALLGFTNPGTGDYSVNSFGATGWQTSTYEVSVTGTYKLGFAVFNLGDTALSPVLMVDNTIGNTDRCVPAGSNCESFGGVAPNNETAPTVVPTTTTVAPTTTTTLAPTTTTTTVPTTTTTTSSTTTTTVPETTTTTTTTTTVPQTTTTTVAPTTTTVYVPTETTTTTSPSTTVPYDDDEEQPEETTTTSVPPIEEEEEEATPTTLPGSDGEDGQAQPEEDQPGEFEQPEPEIDPILPSDEPEEVEQEKQPIKTTAPEETSQEETGDAPQETIVTQEELESIIDDISSENLEIEEILEVIDSLNSEQLTKVLEAIEPEELAKVIDELSEEETVDLIENIESAEALDNVIDSIADSEEPIEVAIAVAIILNDNFTEISSEAAKELFDNIDPGNFNEEEKSELSEVLTEAPSEIKEAFEEEINIYGEGFDEYVPLGSNINVETRRTVIAVTTVLSTITVAGAAGAASGGPGSPSGRPSGGGGSSGGGQPTGGSNDAARREEEEEEEGGGIEGPEDEEDIYLTRNSIFNYYIQGGIEMKKMNWFGLGKKVWEITAGLAFTLAGSFVMFVTLSGETRKMAIIATAVALGVHYIHEVLKNDEE
jgi:hypothetical protein